MPHPADAPSILRSQPSWLVGAVMLCALAFTRLHGAPVISEFMAANKTTLIDEDGDYSDWIEIQNPDDAPINLRGWFLSDNEEKKTKWEFPEVTIAAHGFLVVFASSKDRTDPAGALHTNFGLSNDGEYLGLTAPDGVTTASELSPAFPPQSNDVSYGLVGPASGNETPRWDYLESPSPSAPNGDAKPATPTSRVSFSPPPGTFTGTPALVLTGAQPGEKIRYVLIEAFAAENVVRNDPVSDSPEYTAPLRLDRPLIVRAAVFSADGRAHGPVTAAHYVPLGPGSSPAPDALASELPIVVIDDHGHGALVKDELDHPAWLYTWAPDERGLASPAATPDFAGAIDFSVRGSSSALFPKKSWKFDLVDERGKKSAAPLLGLPAFAEWNLIGPWYYDRAFLRNATAYALSNRIGRWAARTRLVEVYFNHDGGPLDASDYNGVYVLTDKLEVEPGRIDLADPDDDDITGGYLLKVDAADPEKFFWQTDRGFPAMGSVVMVDSPKLSKLTSAQTDYIRDYVQRFEDALYADYDRQWATHGYLEYIDRASWIDHHLLNTFLKNADAFWRSSYFTKGRDAKLVAGPIWDFDRSMGSTDLRIQRWDTWDAEPTPQDGNVMHYWEFGWWGILARDPEFQQDWIDRWQELRQEEFSDEALVELVTGQAAQVGAAAARDAARWPENVSAYGDYAGEIDHLQDWLVRRAQWIDEQFLAPPALQLRHELITLTPPAGAQLIYTLDGTDPRSRGGQPSPSAFVVSGPVVLNGSANVVARAYRADFTGFPGSPWSGRTSRAQNRTAPLSIPSRLVALSARGTVQEGEGFLAGGVTVAAGTGPKSFLVRAVGPTLAHFGVADAVPDPVLRVLDENGEELAHNAGWSTAPDAAALANTAAMVGAFPFATDSRDAALLLQLDPGRYTLQLSSASDRTGSGLVELYETNANDAAIDLSARAFVRRGSPLIGGLVITGPTPKRVLVRGIGPTLAGRGVQQPLADPVLTLYAGPSALASNNDWGSSNNSAAIASAAAALETFPLAQGSRDAALLITLAPGIYTAMVLPHDEGEGIALLEIYDFPFADSSEPRTNENRRD